MSNPDLVIRGGTVADGSGGELFEADVAITGGRISEIGKVASKGRDEIDARGKLVTPGFVDVHTHYDGQVTWSQDMTPSSQNGVTTAIMGNCGVGFAPCKPADHTRLIQLMEGVEDIPEPVLSAGIPWAWESFPDYMEWLSKRDFDIDVGAQLPHAALRVYVMGQRGARRDPSTAEDNAAMAKLAGEAVRSGALGFSTSRTLNHRTSTGDFTPTLKAGEDELTAIAGAMHREGRSVLQFVLDLSTIDEDLPMMLRVADTTKCPISFSITQNDKAPQRWRQTLDEINAAAKAWPLDHRADRRAARRPPARARAVAKPVPDPSELQGNRASAAEAAAGAVASKRGARGNFERDGDRDRRSAVLPSQLRQDVLARRSPRLRAAAGERAGPAGAQAGPAAGGARL
ncbi:N-acyl-D-aspartate/D-glutamate deacylase [Bradyrhizobium sp. LB7.2]